jgi:hypothetical protein
LRSRSASTTPYRYKQNESSWPCNYIQHIWSLRLALSLRQHHAVQVQAERVQLALTIFENKRNDVTEKSEKLIKKLEGHFADKCTVETRVNVELDVSGQSSLESVHDEVVYGAGIK